MSTPLAEVFTIEVNSGRKDFRGVNFAGLNLSGTDFSGADLSGANLCRSNLQEANLRGANLRGAKLKRADLAAANLQHADLTHARLYLARLTEARFLDADLTGADFCLSDGGYTHGLICSSPGVGSGTRLTAVRTSAGVSIFGSGSPMSLEDAYTWTRSTRGEHEQRRLGWLGWVEAELGV